MVRISKDAKPGDYEAAMKMMKEGADKMQKKRARKGISGAMIGKVQWAKSGYAAMQAIEGRTFEERSIIRDFAAAICRQAERRIVTGEDVKSACDALYGSPSA